MAYTLVWLQLLALAAATEKYVTIQKLLYRPPMNGEPPAEVLDWLRTKSQESVGAEDGENYFRNIQGPHDNSILIPETSETLVTTQKHENDQDVLFGSRLSPLNSSKDDSDMTTSITFEHNNLSLASIPIEDSNANLEDNDTGSDNSSHNTLYLSVERQNPDSSRVKVNIGKSLGLKPMHRKASQESDADATHSEVASISIGNQRKSLLQARRAYKAAKKTLRIHEKEATARQENVSNVVEDEHETGDLATFHPSHRSSDPYGQTYQYNIQDPITGIYRFGYAAPGQWRHEERHLNGVVLGRYGWQDAHGHQHQTHFVADARGYRIVRPGQQIETYAPAEPEYEEDRVKRPNFPLPHPHFLPATGRPPIAYPLPEGPSVTHRPGNWFLVNSPHHLDVQPPNLRPIRPPSPLRPLHKIYPKPTTSSFLPEYFEYRPESVIHRTTESVSSKSSINHLVPQINKSSIEEELFGLLTPPGPRHEANEVKSIIVQSNNTTNHKHQKNTTNGLLMLLNLFKGFKSVPITDDKEVQNGDLNRTKKSMLSPYHNPDNTVTHSHPSDLTTFHSVDSAFLDASSGIESTTAPPSNFSNEENKASLINIFGSVI